MINTSKFNLENIAGVISQQDTERFKRMIFRASKGNVLSILEQIDSVDRDALVDPLNNKEMQSFVFILIF